VSSPGTSDKNRTDEVQCPCCLGAGKLISDQGTVPCPLCEGYKTVPVEVAHRFLEVAAKRIPGGEAGEGQGEKAVGWTSNVSFINIPNYLPQMFTDPKSHQ
jgi:hypothetical protein